MSLKFAKTSMQTLYAFSRSHHLLDSNYSGHSGISIGHRGCNLTISFLSMNRVALSVKLLRSIEEYIPDFAGQILIIDNGSTIENLNRLKDAASGFNLNIRIIALGENKGVAGGRNAATEHIQTVWVMSLDNDIYFIADPLDQLQQDISQLGCHFMSLPLLAPDGAGMLSFGGQLGVSASEDGSISLAIDKTFELDAGCAMTRASFLCTYFSGGASVFQLDSFKAAGSYDEAMFIGFEDIEFCFRLFRRGMKIGCFGYPFLVHDHQPPTTETDVNYEEMRFSKSIILESARHFEKKHGVKIWNENVNLWLRRRRKALGLDEEL